MLCSMTGFGSAQGKVQSVEYAVEVRSVNSRYLKTVVKLPESFSAIEGEVDKFLRQRFGRGSIVLTVRMRVSDDQAAYHVNAAALANYIDQLKPLEIEANPMLRIDLGSLLQLPGVCQPPSLDELCRETYSGLMELIAKALEGLIEMRQQEGQAIKTELLKYCNQIEQKLSAVEARAPNVIRDYQERLLARVEELTHMGNLQIDKDSLAREVAIFAERCDIAEELARLGGHVEQFRQALSADEPVGRKLDFITQEMLREANAIASKANDTDIARAVVDTKTAIDRIKEQVQNLQ